MSPHCIISDTHAAAIWRKSAAETANFTIANTPLAFSVAVVVVVNTASKTVRWCMHPQWHPDVVLLCRPFVDPSAPLFDSKFSIDRPMIQTNLAWPTDMHRLFQRWATAVSVCEGILSRRLFCESCGRCANTVGHAVHCEKYPYIHGYFEASFPYFNGTGSVYVVSVNLTE